MDNKFNTEVFKRNLRELRKQKGLTQKDLCEKLGANRTFISRIETAERIPSLETVVAIANALEVSTDDLLIDSIENSEKHDNEVDYVLLDCTPGEVKVLTKNLKNLRETIREFKIK